MRRQTILVEELRHHRGAAVGTTQQRGPTRGPTGGQAHCADGGFRAGGANGITQRCRSWRPDRARGPRRLVAAPPTTAAVASSATTPTDDHSTRNARGCTGSAVSIPGRYDAPGAPVWAAAVRSSGALLRPACPSPLGLAVLVLLAAQGAAVALADEPATEVPAAASVLASLLVLLLLHLRRQAGTRLRWAAALSDAGGVVLVAALPRWWPAGAPGPTRQPPLSGRWRSPRLSRCCLPCSWRPRPTRRGRAAAGCCLRVWSP